MHRVRIQDIYVRIYVTREDDVSRFNFSIFRFKFFHLILKRGEHRFDFEPLISRLILDVYDVYGRRGKGTVKIKYYSCFSSRRDVTFEWMYAID